MLSLNTGLVLDSTAIAAPNGQVWMVMHVDEGTKLATSPMQKVHSPCSISEHFYRCRNI
jgi:hypothetical protein